MKRGFISFKSDSLPLFLLPKEKRERLWKDVACKFHVFQFFISTREYKWNEKAKWSEVFCSRFRPYLNAKKIIKSLSFHFSFSCSLVSTLLFASHTHLALQWSEQVEVGEEKLYPKRFFHLHSRRLSSLPFIFQSFDTATVRCYLSKLKSVQVSVHSFHSLSMLKVINCNVQKNKILRTEWNVCSAVQIRSLHTANTARASLTLQHCTATPSESYFAISLEKLSSCCCSVVVYCVQRLTVIRRSTFCPPS